MPVPSGDKHWNWKGGIWKKIDGYVFLLRKNHPNCNKYGYVKRSRLVIEESLGRYLKRNEVVHHINKIRNDDRIENLKLFSSNQEHIKEHSKDLIGKPRLNIRIYKRVEKLENPTYVNDIVYKGRKKYIVKLCGICKNKFWTKYRSERKLTTSCSKKCFKIHMIGVVNGRN